MTSPRTETRKLCVMLALACGSSFWVVRSCSIVIHENFPPLSETASGSHPRYLVSVTYTRAQCFRRKRGFRIPPGTPINSITSHGLVRIHLHEVDYRFSLLFAETDSQHFPTRDHNCSSFLRYLCPWKAISLRGRT
jgi:hypothetical protein